MRVWSTDYNNAPKSHSQQSLPCLSRESAFSREKDVLPRIVVYSARATFLHFLARERRGCVFLVLRRGEVGLEVLLLLLLWQVLRRRRRWVILILRLRGGGWLDSTLVCLLLCFRRFGEGELMEEDE
jgi:hypothetical protein